MKEECITLKEGKSSRNLKDELYVFTLSSEFFLKHLLNNLWLLGKIGLNPSNNDSYFWRTSAPFLIFHNNSHICEGVYEGVVEEGVVMRVKMTIAD